MASVEVTINGMLYDKLNRTTQNVVLIGEAMLTGVGVGGGPIMPPGGGQPPGGGLPDHIWGPTDPRPTPPIANVPGAPGYRPPGIWPNPPEGIAPHPEHPIVIPVPPNTPNVPPPGSPPVMIGGSQPVQPITPPPAIIVEYPGIGKVLVPQPTQTGEAPQQA